MGAELVTDESAPHKRKSFREICDELCPYYMSLGMTYDEFWHGNTDMLRQFRKKFKYERDRQNQLLWLQGYYNYVALCKASPIFNSLAPEGTKAEPYLEEPIPLTQKQIEEYEEREKRKRFEKFRAYMESRQLAREQGGD